MPMKEVSYDKARAKMKAGDVIAFGGKSSFSKVIKFTTRCNVSHVGVLLQTQVQGAGSDGYFNQVIESVGEGVGIYQASYRVAHYEGDVWWLPRDESLKFEAGPFYEWLLRQRGKEYDLPQAVKSATDIFDDTFLGHGPGYNREDFSRLFCSELVAEGLERAGVIGKVNASEVTPIDLCRWRIYEPTYYLLKKDHPDSEARTIARYNTADPADWA